jgi:ELWxxDGT repeat protein
MAQNLIFLDVGGQFYVSNGTASGTTVVFPISGAYSDGIFGNGEVPTFAVLNGVAYFAGHDDSQSYGPSGLWSSAGTAATTKEITGIAEENSGGNLFGGSADIISAFGELLFDGSDQNSIQSLWVSNGTGSGTFEVTNIGNTYAGGLFDQISNPDFTSFDGSVLFDGRDAAGTYGLWVTADGTAGGTHEIADISGADSTGIFTPVTNQSTADFTVIGGGAKLIFSGVDASGHTNIWVMTSPAAAPVELSDVSGAAEQGLLGGSGAPPDFTPFGNGAVFQGFAYTGSSVNPKTGQTQYQEQIGLWYTDGSSAGTTEINVAEGNDVIDTIPSFAVLNGVLIFLATDTSEANSLWVLSSPGATAVELSPPTAPFSLSPSSLTTYGGYVYFIGDDKNNDTGLWRTDGTNTGTVEIKVLSDTVAATIPMAAVMLALTPVPSDFYGAGNSDLLFQNTGGDYAMWQTNGTAVTGGGNVGSPGTGWTEIATGDFGTGSKSDILFESSGASYALWDMNGTAVTTVATFGNPGAGFSFVDVGNFDGTGNGDILFENTGGDYAMWETNGTAVTGGGNVGSPGTGWSEIAIGTFGTGTNNGILFQSSGGTYALWDMSGTTVSNVVTFGSPGAGWNFVAVGNFDGSGGGDILFENTAGDYAVWLTNGTSITGGGNLGSPGGTFSFAAIGDFNGDGKSDILFQSTAGSATSYAAWEMNGATIANVATFGSPGPGWTLQHSG